MICRTSCFAQEHDKDLWKATALRLLSLVSMEFHGYPWPTKSKNRTIRSHPVSKGGHTRRRPIESVVPGAPCGGREVRQDGLAGVPEMHIVKRIVY